MSFMSLLEKVFSYFAVSFAASSAVLRYSKHLYIFTSYLEESKKCSFCLKPIDDLFQTVFLLLPSDPSDALSLTESKDVAIDSPIET